MNTSKSGIDENASVVDATAGSTQATKIGHKNSSQDNGRTVVINALTVERGFLTSPYFIKTPYTAYPFFQILSNSLPPLFFLPYFFG